MFPKAAIVAVVMAVGFIAGVPVEPSPAGWQGKPHPCAAGAVPQARKLLAFHAGPDDRLAVDDAVKRLAPIRNPANRAQQFDVLELQGHIYKGQYRIRLIYAQVGGQCVLMGQEILEVADL
jgi:hypothetical protein